MSKDHWYANTSQAEVWQHQFYGIGLIIYLGKSECPFLLNNIVTNLKVNHENNITCIITNYHLRQC